MATFPHYQSVTRSPGFAARFLSRIAPQHCARRAYGAGNPRPPDRTELGPPRRLRGAPGPLGSRCGSAGRLMRCFAVRSRYHRSAVCHATGNRNPRRIRRARQGRPAHPQANHRCCDHLADRHRPPGVCRRVACLLRFPAGGLSSVRSRQASTSENRPDRACPALRKTLYCSPASLGFPAPAFPLRFVPSRPLTIPQHCLVQSRDTPREPERRGRGRAGAALRRSRCAELVQTTLVTREPPRPDLAVKMKRGAKPNEQPS